jgi:hypothetical protein
MFDHCQPILINNLYGSLTVNINESLSCIKPRQWYFSYDYGYTLLIRFINISYLISNSYIFKIYSTRNKEKKLLYDSRNSTSVNNDIQFDFKDDKSSVLVELISANKRNIQQTSFIIDYVFRGKINSDFQIKLNHYFQLLLNHGMVDKYFKIILLLHHHHSLYHNHHLLL